MSKMTECLDLLRSENGSDLSNPEIAELVGCSEAHVRRARAVLKTVQLAASVSEDPDDNTRLLADIINKFRARAELNVLLADAVATVKNLRATIRELNAALEESVSTAAEEHPLFDRPAVAETGDASDLAETDEPEIDDETRDEIEEGAKAIGKASRKGKSKGRPVMAASL